MSQALILPIGELGYVATARAILAGELVVIPTDTVYGLAARPTADGVARLFQAKGRREDRPIPVLLADAEARASVVAAWPDTARVLAELFWPGPLTIVVPARTGLPPALTAASGNVGVRLPANVAAREVLRRCGGHLAVTSANRSGEAPARTAEEAANVFGGHVACVLDGGRLGAGVPSTVVLAAPQKVTICRLGAIPAGALRWALPASIRLVEET
jgi:tRNA threonylcarbamoyl adenosine modification protein (Sua5/YciO/YrdC/YwlC family)